MRLTIYGRPLRAMVAVHLNDLVRAMVLRVADPRSGVLADGHQAENQSESNRVKPGQTKSRHGEVDCRAKNA
jgi:hypothetical protein